MSESDLSCVSGCCVRGLRDMSSLRGWARVCTPVARTAAVFLLAFSMGSAGSVAADEKDGFPAKVDAVYSIAWNGMELGNFVFSSAVKNGEYTLRGNTKLSAVMGAFTWSGFTQSLGKVASGKPQPAAYAFSFEGSSKSGRIDMRFRKSAVTKVTSVPPIQPSPGRVPVTEAQLKGVLDPLSAVMAVTAPVGGKVAGVNPCKRKIPIFDGKQRFDLIFTHARNEKLEGADAFVCKVKYVPISGHKMNKETKFMASTDGIEIWLIPVPEAKIFVPYYVTLPTPVGAATITSVKVSIDTPDGRVALSN